MGVEHRGGWVGLAFSFQQQAPYVNGKQNFVAAGNSYPPNSPHSPPPFPLYVKAWGNRASSGKAAAENPPDQRI